MLVNLKATPAGKYIIEEWGKDNALHYWDDREALDLLEAIINKLPVQFNSQALHGLLDRGFIEIEPT